MPVTCDHGAGDACSPFNSLNMSDRPTLVNVKNISLSIPATKTIHKSTVKNNISTTTGNRNNRIQTKIYTHFCLPANSFMTWSSTFNFRKISDSLSQDNLLIDEPLYILVSS